MNSENPSEEIQESGRLLLADGPWDPLGDEPRPLEYTMRKKGERTYAKNAAVDTTFQVKVNDRYRGQRLRDIRQGLQGMFEDILQEACGRPWDRFRGFIKRREAGIFPFYSGMFPLLLLINLYRVYRQILSKHLPTLP